MELAIALFVSFVALATVILVGLRIGQILSAWYLDDAPVTKAFGVFAHAGLATPVLVILYLVWDQVL